MFQLIPLPLTVSCFSKIQIGFAFLVPAYLSSTGKRAVKRVCVLRMVTWTVIVCVAGRLCDSCVSQWRLQQAQLSSEYSLPQRWLTDSHLRHLRFDLRFDLERFGIDKKWGFEIWLNDLNPFLKRFEIWVKDLMWDLCVTATDWLAGWARFTVSACCSTCLSVCIVVH